MRKFSASSFSARNLTTLSVLCLMTFSLALFPSCASREAIRKRVYEKSESAALRGPKGRRYHVVRKGETLYSISRRYGVSVSALKRANRIADVRDIKVGARLLIPPSKGAATPKRARKPRRQKAKRTERAPKVRTKFSWPLKKFRISSKFGVRSSRKHDGIDLSAPKGTPILAAADGKVIFAGWGPAGYGRIVMIKHDKRSITIYAHNDRNFVRQGQRVKKGQKIATVGRSGRASGYHLHFEVRIDRKPVNPQKYLPRR